MVAHGDVVPADGAHLDGADLVIAADGGALACERWGRVPSLVVGDVDSLGTAAIERVKAAGGRVEPHPAEKDASDTELAVERAIASGADEIVVLGALGSPRLDHEIANVLLLADVAYRGRTVRAVRGGTSVRALHGGDRLALAGLSGETVTLLPVGGDADGVRTFGLRYALDGERLRFGRSRGLSNAVERAGASVSCERGILLVIESARGGA